MRPSMNRFEIINKLNREFIDRGLLIDPKNSRFKTEEELFGYNSWLSKFNYRIWNLDFKGLKKMFSKKWQDPYYG
jgi:hypothetical protein